MIDQQRHTEQMLSLFHAVFGQRPPGAPQPGTGGLPGGFPGLGDMLGGMGMGGSGNSRPNQQREREEDRSAFAGMYS